jgi:hypothetical protein
VLGPPLFWSIPGAPSEVLKVAQSCPRKIFRPGRPRGVARETSIKAISSRTLVQAPRRLPVDLWVAWLVSLRPRLADHGLGGRETLGARHVDVGCAAAPPAAHASVTRTTGLRRRVLRDKITEIVHVAILAQAWLSGTRFSTHFSRLPWWSILGQTRLEGRHRQHHRGEAS